ncbi:MAG: LacI family DNA-binding transcriptional regulator [Sagittula sp.]|uniref:LacI family DNA-binding transcriptional regulator n=1 Tax=Sagittula sp. TaxID=2038081 RepID=UPI004059187D
MDRRLPTLSDVARRAGVSYATVDRVVNDRGGVTEKSALRVRDAIAELGYVRNVAAANLSQRRTYRFAVILPLGSSAFFTRIRDLFGAADERLRHDRVWLRMETVPAFDPEALCACLDRLAAEGLDGIAVVGNDDPRVAEALGALHARGVGVLTLVADVPGAAHDGYVGIDNTVAGRTAARLIALAHGGRPGRVLPIVGALNARDHAERLAGLRETLAAHPELALSPEIEGRDRHEIVEARVKEALEADPGITAIYSAGAGNSGLIRVIEARQAVGRRPVVLLHDLLPNTRRALEAGLIDIIIDQRPEDEVARVLSGLRRIADKREAPPPDPIIPAIYVRENLTPEAGAISEGQTT